MLCLILVVNRFFTGMLLAVFPVASGKWIESSPSLDKLGRRLFPVVVVEHFEQLCRNRLDASLVFD